jgi:hypothetical protein
MPTESDILYLQRHPETAREFDRLWGEGTSSQYIQTQKPETTEEPEEKEGRGLFKDTALQVAGGLRDAIGETLDTFESVNEGLSKKTNLGGITFGKYADNGIIDIKSYEEFAEQDIPVLGQGQIDTSGDLHKTYNTYVPEVPDADTMVGAFVRPVSQFFSGYLGGGKLLKGANVLQKSTTGTKIAKSMVQGAFADFTVFDEHTERVSDLVESVDGLQNPVTEYLASDPNDSFAEGKFKLALEGLALGGAVETVFLGFRRMKNLNRAKNEGDETAFKEIDKAETKAIDDSINTPKPKKKTKKEQKAQRKKDALDDIDSKKSEANAQSSLDYIHEGFKEDYDRLDEVFDAWRRGDVNPATGQKWALKDILDKTFASGQWAKNGTNGNLLILNQLTDKLARNLKDTKRTNEEALILAVKLGKTPEVIQIHLNRLATEMADAEVKVLAGHIMQISMADALLTTGMRIKYGTATKEEFFKLYFQFEALSQSLDTIVSKSSRVLNVQKQRVEGSVDLSSDILASLSNIKREIDWIPTKEAEDLIIKRIQQLADGDTGRLNKFVSAVARLSGLTKGGAFINAINEAFVNFILSNPKTHLVNMTSNLIQMLVTPTEMMMGGVLKGDGRLVKEGIDTYVGVWKYMGDAFTVAYHSLKTGENYLDDVTKLDMDYKKAIKGKFGMVNLDKVGEGVRTPSRFLGAEDEFFKQMNYRAKMYARAMQLARAKYKTGAYKNTKEMAEDVEDMFAKSFDENGKIVNGVNTGRGLNDYALDYAQTNTFTKSLDDKIRFFDSKQNKYVKESRSKYGAKVQDFVNDAPILRQFIPFIRTPVNIMREVWKRTPLLNMAQREFREKLLKGTPSQQAMARGQFAMGSVICFSAYQLAFSGKITGGGHSNRQINQQQRDAGWKPYSFKIMDRYVPFERLDPWGMFFGIWGDFAEIKEELSEEEHDTAIYMAITYVMETSGMTNMDATEFMKQYTPTEESGFQAIAFDGLNAVAKNLTSKTYLKGLTDILDAVNGDNPNKFEALMKSKASGFVPNIIKNIIRDPHYREIRSIWDGFKSGIPFYNRDLEPKFRADGSIIDRANTYWEGLLNPVPFSKSKNLDDIVIQEFARLKEPFTPLDTTMGINGNVDLLEYTTKEAVKIGDIEIPKGATSHYAMNLLLKDGKLNYYGKNLTLKETLETIIKSDAYQNELTDKLEVRGDMTISGTKGEMLKKSIREFRDFAKREIKNSNAFTNENGGTLRKAFDIDKNIDKVNETQSGLEYLGLE